MNRTIVERMLYNSQRKNGRMGEQNATYTLIHLVDETVYGQQRLVF